MLKGIDPLLTPDLLRLLAQMGHGDVLAVVDRNYPAHAAGAPVVELAGADLVGALRAILAVLPVDTFIDPPAWHMLMDSGASVRHKGYVYHFSGLVYHPGQQRWRVSIEKYRWTKEPFEDFMELVYHYTSDEEEDCINHLTEDILWDGKSFYQLEKALTWIDW